MRDASATDKFQVTMISTPYFILVRQVCVPECVTSTCYNMHFHIHSHSEERRFFDENMSLIYLSSLSISIYHEV